MNAPPMRDDMPFLGLVTGPGALRTLADAVTWGEDHRDKLREALHARGALLLRGFPLRSAEDFSAFFATQEAQGMGYTGGFTVREPVAAQVYTSTSAPPFVSIPLHTEMAYDPRPPHRIYLFCAQPAQKGGQTPLADARRVLAGVDPGLTLRLRERGLRYLRNLPPLRGRVWPPSGWRQAYSADTPAQAESAARASGCEVDWFGEELRITQRGPVTRVHPVTGEECWFNQLHNFHHSNSAEFWQAGVYWGWALFRLIEAQERWSRPPDRLSVAVTDGEGQPITTAEALGVRQAIWREARSFDWAPGDLLVTDNHLVMHGRAPYKGERRVYAALAQDTAAP